MSSGPWRKMTRRKALALAAEDSEVRRILSSGIAPDQCVTYLLCAAGACRKLTLCGASAESPAQSQSQGA